MTMTKHSALIPDEPSNWEIALFLLLDFSHPSLMKGNKFTRASLYNRIENLSFLEELLIPMGHEWDGTERESASNRLSIMERNKYIHCTGDGQCYLTEKGISRQQEILKKFETATPERIEVAKARKVIQALTEEERKRLLEALNIQANS